MQYRPQLRNTNTSQLFEIGILGVLLFLYAPVLIHWYDGWMNKSISTEHEYFSHGLIGLPFAGYLTWINRKKWQRLNDSMHPIGAFLLLIGGIFYLTGVGEWVNLSFPTILTGLCLWLKGAAGFKLYRFPLLLAFLATPNSVPYLIAPFTMPLQSFIAGTAGLILNQLGMNVNVDEIYIYINGTVVEVAPYCAGLKMLFTTMYVGLMLLYWTGAISSRRKIIWFLSIAGIISVIANIIRNTFLTFFHGTGKENLFVWLHDSWGGDMYSALMLLSLIPILNWIDQKFPDSLPESE
ncbi:cyanoexosortase B [Calothrix sp. PCC 6303]|uniref:cyanoexosortase B n=1 Tax=Calothrix sp. PCC 6303 TaxID=1170562 RepID=UPI0002A032F1|nr:cyanoexosortase B [Calothrix sp. PCC 6303]AFZ03723.1 eight transmembrane protein EpsH [Calothrix sp. PCC 6303]